MSFVEYPHRRNHDGTHDSICSRCFATIATEPLEDDLAPHEHRHLCKRSFPTKLAQPGNLMLPARIKS